MPTKEERDQLISEIVRTLYDRKAHTWSVQDKGVLVAAIKLQLEERSQQTQQQ
jgi:hypothetical protein